jgi:AraC-like DNA-binding protein
MHFHFSFYSSLLLILFSQGILFALLLLVKGFKTANKSYKWLSLFTFLCSCYLLPWMLGHAGWYSLQPYRDVLFYIPTQQQLLIGPVIFYYTQSLLNPAFKINRRNWWHLLPALLYALYSIVVFITDKVVLHEYYFYANGKDKDLDKWYQFAGLLSMLFYGWLSLRYYQLYKKIIYQAISYADAVLLGWVKKYLLSFFAMQVIMLCLLVFSPSWGGFTQKWWYYFLFGCLTYYIALTAYVNQKTAVIGFIKSFGANQPVYLLYPENNLPFQPQEKMLLTMQPAVDKATDAAELEPFKKRIKESLEQEKIYTNPDLTLPLLAQQAGISVAVASKVINLCFGLNFNDFINQYRVDAVKQLLLTGEHQRQTILSIGFECGFNSKTTFNRSFRKITGLSPKEFAAAADEEKTVET